MNVHSYRVRKDPLIREMVETLIECGMSRAEAEAEVIALMEWAGETK